MIEDFRFLTEIYEDIYLWLTFPTPGDRRTKKYFIDNDKKIWNKIKNKIIELEKKDSLTQEEREFLTCKYVGKAYRKINYYIKRKGQVYPINCYQSCSKSIEGLKKVNINGNVTLIRLYANKKSYAIDIYKLLLFMIRYKLIKYKDKFDINYRNVRNLERFIGEEEVVVIISKDNIKSIHIRNFETGLNVPLDEDKWYRNNID